MIRDLVSDEYGVIVMSSSLGNEFSLESASVQHGLYTLALVEGLSGRADRNLDGSIHLRELDWYVAWRVDGLSRGQQHPVVNRSPRIRSFPLATQSSLVRSERAR